MRIVFFGSSAFAVGILEELAKNEDVVLVVTQPDRKKGRALKVSPTAIKSCAERLGFKIFQPLKVNTKESIGYLRGFDADLFIVVSFGQILSKTLLDLPKLYSLNVHASLLPKFRGAAPINWAIASGEKETGVTIMRMNEKMDEGDTAIKAVLPITEQDDAITLSEKLSRKAVELLLEAVELVKDNKIEFMAQDHKKATYAPKLEKQNGLIDWNLSAEEISRCVRAFTPWPGCFTYWDKKILKIWKAVPIIDYPDNRLQSGAILEANKDVILIKTGKGALKITELQLEGSRRMATEEFLAGHKFDSGNL